jgi:ribosylpyrimidine nucleosidase
MKRKIILDCDPGHDDAIAIMLAGKHPLIELEAITVVAGNQTLEKTVKNALNVCQHLDIKVPVYAGCEGPMVRDKQVIADDIHGETGLDGPVFKPLIKKKSDQHAVNFLVNYLSETKDKVTLVVTGPMTNIAMALRMKPSIKEQIEEIVIMGGSIRHGNVTPAAEFNILADAEAAHVVFTAGRPLVMVGLDVTREVLCYPEIITRMAAHENVAARLFSDLMTFFNKTQKDVFGWEGGPLHDPVTIAYLIKPEVLTLTPMVTTIDYRGGESYGRTNCDYFGFSKEKPNVQVATAIDVDAFWKVVEEGIKCYDDTERNAL